MSLKYGQMTLTVETVTPTVSERWLQQNSANRRLRDQAVDNYARDMNAGNWECKPVAICFDEEDRLGNGQHTLSAIVKSGVAQELLIARNVPRRSIAAMDRGLRRTINDISNFIGSELNSQKATIAKTVKWGPRATPKTFDELYEAYLEHTDAIDFVSAHAAHVVGMNASVLAVCAKAYYMTDKAVIERFLTVLKTGMIEGAHESAAIRLRDFCRSLRGANSAKAREETYQKTMSTLDSFIKGTPMTKVYGTVVDLFPIK